MARDPGSADALCTLALCQLNLGHHGEGLRTAGEVLRLAPDDEWAHRLRSIALLRLGRPAEAAAAAREAIRLAPQVEQGHRALAHALMKLPGFGAEADAAARRALERAPHDPATHFTLGLVADSRGDDRTAEAAYRKTLELDPAHSMALNNLAVGAIRSQRLGDATQLLRAAVGEDARNSNALANLDAVVIWRIRWICVVTGLCCVVLMFAAAGDPAPVSPATRAGIGTALVALSGAFAWVTIGRLRRETSLGPVGLLRWLSRRHRRQLVVLAGPVTLVVAAYVPSSVAAYAFAQFGVVIGLLVAPLPAAIRVLSRRRQARWQARSVPPLVPPRATLTAHASLPVARDTRARGTTTTGNERRGAGDPP